MAGSNEYITLSRLQSFIKNGIDNSHPFPYWVAAEISELKVSISGHCYVDLVEKGEGQQSARAKLRGMIWSNTYAGLSMRFAAETKQRLEAGMNVLVKVVVTYHELYGISLQIIDIDSAYTLGDIERQRRETIHRLKADGVFDMNRELDMPMVVQRLAVISSPNAAGYQDFMNELTASRYRFEVELFESLMQGAESERYIIGALDAIMEREDSFDAVVIIRGGGSQSDLSCFDSYDLCNNIAQFPLPIITGIGHDKDNSVADLVSALSLKTPTAVAVHLVNGLTEFESSLDDLLWQITDHSQVMISDCEIELNNLAMVLNISSARALNSANLQLERVSMTLKHESSRVVERLFVSAEQYLADLRQFVNLFLNEERRCVHEYESKIVNGFAQLFDATQKELSLLEAVVMANDPRHIIEKGFAFVSFSGRMLDGVSELQEGDAITITLRDGSVESIVNKIDLKD